MEGVRQGRHHHLGNPGDRLSIGGPGQARVRASRMPPRCRVLLVHVFAHTGPASLRPRRARGDVPRREGPRERPGARLGRCGRRPDASEVLPTGTGQGRPGPGVVGRGHRDGSRGARPHHQDLRPRPLCRLLAHPGDVDGVALCGHPFHPAHRRRDDVVLRLVRRPPGRQPAGVRRPDRCARIRRLVGRHLSDDVGLQRPGHAHA